MTQTIERSTLEGKLQMLERRSKSDPSGAISIAYKRALRALEKRVQQTKTALSNIRLQEADELDKLRAEL